MKQSKSTRTPGRTPRKPKPASSRKKAAPHARASAPRKSAAAGATAPALRDAGVSRKAAGPLALPAECLISSVDEIKAGLVQRLDSPDSVTIDACAVQRIDTASLQVIAAFARDRRAAGLPFSWSGVPAAVNDAAALLNLTDTLGLDAAATAADTVLA
jgi:phospholipid transport system transporter-binding protein